MKIILATAIAALVPTAAMASDGNAYDGYASFSAGYNSLDAGAWSNQWYDYGDNYSDSGNGNGKADGLDLEARASAAVPLGGNFGAQIDGVFSRTGYKQSNCTGCNTVHINESTLSVHAFSRKPKKGLFGLVGQRTAQDWSYGPAHVTYYVGGEAQAFLGRVTLGSQLTYALGDTNGNNTSEDGVNVALQMRYFPKDNLMVALRGGHEQITRKPGGNSEYNCPDYCFREKNTGWEVGGKVEYRLPKSRLSFLADVDYRDLSYDNQYDNLPNYWSHYTAKYSDVRAMIGIKLNFGAGSLFERDRSGASLDPVRPIANSMLGFGS